VRVEEPQTRPPTFQDAEPGPHRPLLVKEEQAGRVLFTNEPRAKRRPPSTRITCRASTFSDALRFSRGTAPTRRASPDTARRPHPIRRPRHMVGSRHTNRCHAASPSSSVVRVPLYSWAMSCTIDNLWMASRIHLTDLTPDGPWVHVAQTVPMCDTPCPMFARNLRRVTEVRPRRLPAEGSWSV
jgi:hypothetical protein